MIWRSGEDLLAVVVAMAIWRNEAEKANKRNERGGESDRERKRGKREGVSRNKTKSPTCCINI